MYVEDGSHAQVINESEADGQHRVIQGGCRRLWDTVETAHEWWVRLRNPGPCRFNVVANSTIQFVSLDGDTSLVTLATSPSLALELASATEQEFAEFKPVAYLDSETSSLFLEKPVEIAAYQSILAALAETALGEGESRQPIVTLTTELYADREDHDDRA